MMPIAQRRWRTIDAVNLPSGPRISIGIAEDLKGPQAS
jgi:hypothetical protein